MLEENTNSTDEIGFQTANGTEFRTSGGVQGFTVEPVNAAPTPQQDPNTQRWLFNPFRFIKNEDVAPVGHTEFEGGRFIPVKNFTFNSPLSGMTSSGAPIGQGATGIAGNELRHHDTHHVGGAKAGDRYITRSAYQIADELTARHAEVGLMQITALFGVTDDETVNLMNRALISQGLEYVSDPNLPEHPVPNLVKLEQFLLTEGAARARVLDNGDSPVKAGKMVAEVLASVRQAIAHCRAVTHKAIEVVSNRTKGYTHAYDAYQQRCFLALGEEIPSNIPFVTNNQNQSNALVNEALTAILTEIKDRQKPAVESDELAQMKQRMTEMEAMLLARSEPDAKVGETDTRSPQQKAADTRRAKEAAAAAAAQ